VAYRVNTPKQDGDFCEEWVIQVCEWLGYSVRDDRALKLSHDLVINSARTQVKGRRNNLDSEHSVRGSFYLKVHLQAHETAYLEGSVDVFVICHYRKWYIVPSHAMPKTEDGFRNGVSISEIAEWRNRWDVLDGERVSYSEQKCFDF
jgi:hypothetical protein